MRTLWKRITQWFHRAPSSGMALTAPRIPRVGDALRLDGYNYALLEYQRRYDSQGRPVDLWRFGRPEDRRDVRGHPYYAREGLCLANDLTWTSPQQFTTAVKDQGLAMMRTRPALTPWAQAAMDATLARHAESAACWTLGSRHLPKYPPGTSPSEVVPKIAALLAV